MSGQEQSTTKVVAKQVVQPEEDPVLSLARDSGVSVHYIRFVAERPSQVTTFEQALEVLRAVKDSDFRKPALAGVAGFIGEIDFDRMKLVLDEFSEPESFKKDDSSVLRRFEDSLAEATTRLLASGDPWSLTRILRLSKQDSTKFDKALLGLLKLREKH